MIYEAVMFKPWMYHYSKLPHLFVFGLSSAARRKEEEYYHINNEDSCTQVNISDNKQSLIHILFCTNFLFTHMTLLQKKAGQTHPLVGHYNACSAILSFPVQ